MNKEKSFRKFGGRVRGNGVWNSLLEVRGREVNALEKYIKSNTEKD